MNTNILTGIGIPPERRFRDGYGVIKHSALTLSRVKAMLAYLSEAKRLTVSADPYEILSAGDLIANAAMWLVVHSTYTNRVYLDGRMLEKEDFKPEPEGHTGGSLNIVPGYVGYLMLNALMDKTRAWMMEQGHTVSAIDAVNLIVGNMKKAHSERYELTDEGLSRFVSDFYSYSLNEKGEQDSPRGSHVNHNTAGGFLEGGYLGFASVQYIHVPLPHERLVVFLSDGAFEEQKGGDWAPRFWRAEDSGLAIPIMIFNGRRIDQRSTMSQIGGPQWLYKYMKLHNFDPIVFDGKDPASFAWAIFEMEHKLKRYIKALDGPNQYPIPLPYGIAVAPKGAGFYGEGTNEAHNLPLVKNPYVDELTRERFNYHARRLWVDAQSLKKAADLFNNHGLSRRLQEKEHPIANRKVSLKVVPEISWKDVPKNREDINSWIPDSPMNAIDHGFTAITDANPQLRARVGNPDEMRSNRMLETLESLKFRSDKPEGGNLESISGGIITALNEEAIAGAAFGNKGGINIIVTYEAFGAKIFGEARQEVIFAQHQQEAGEPAGWLSVPIVLASHTWENSKNEQSHQDPSMAESMFGEMACNSRVVFPPDWNTSAVVIRETYQTHGQIWTIVASKRGNPTLFTGEESETMIRDGGIRLRWAEHDAEHAKLALFAIGAYQLAEVLKAASRLRKANIPFIVSCILEPGRFRYPRSKCEQLHLASGEVRNNLLPDGVKHVSFVVHTRPEILVGALHGWFGARTVSQFGFMNNGGTLTAEGLLFINGTTWAHILRDTAIHGGFDESKVLSEDEIAALNHQKSPDGVIVGKSDWEKTEN